MNKLALATLLTTLISQAAGCIIDTTDRDHGHGGGGGGSGTGVDTAAISARWSLRNMIDGAVATCPPGFDTVQLIAQAIDSNGDPVGDQNIDLFDCNARGGVASDLAPDVYQVWIEVRSHDLQGLYAQSLSQVLDVRTDDQTFTAEVLKDGGYFQLSWDLIGRTTNRPVACSQVAGLDAIRAISTNITSSTISYQDAFVCDDHSAVSGGLLEGPYTISIDALAGDKSVGRATALTTKVIAGQNQVTDLGTIAIPIDGM